MTTLFRNDSPGALTLEQARQLEIKRLRERRRQAEDLAAQGRGEDTEIAHVAHGELVIPEILQTPEFLDVIGRAAAEHGIPLERLRVGSQENSVNPATGAPEFLFDGLTRGIADFFRRSPPPAVPAQQISMPKLESLPTTPFAPPSGIVDPNILPNIERHLDPLNPHGEIDPETVRRAYVLYGETGSVYPHLKDPNGSVYNPANWQEGSAEELAKVRAQMGVVAGRNRVTHQAVPNMSNPIEMKAWQQMMDAAKASRGLDQTFDPRLRSFYMRQQGTYQDQYVPRYDGPPMTAGPFYTTPGGRKPPGGKYEVPGGNNLYIDFFHEQARTK